MKKQFFIVLTALLLVMCLAACGKENKSQENTPAEPQAPVVDAALVGTWEEADVPEEQQLGDYWTFASNGKGVYGLMDVEITFTASNGELHFSCDFGEYDYTYSIEGDILTLTEEGSSPNKYKKTN